MTWDTRKMASEFLMKANAVRPEEADNVEERSRLTAMQEIFYECYMNSFDQQKVISFLKSASENGHVTIPEDAEEQAYTASFRSTALRVLKDVLR